MPEFVSNSGEWTPKKERIALKNKSDEVIVNPHANDGKPVEPGQEFIYEGPDREAVKMIEETEGKGAKKIGRKFTRDAEFIKAVKTMGFNTVPEYLKFIDYDEAVAEAKFKEVKDAKSHEPEVKKEEPLITGAGIDQTGNESADVIGGFGDERLRPASEVRKGRGRPRK